MASTASFRITGKPKPVLMLKDFLRDDPNSDSFRRLPAATTTVPPRSRVADNHRPALMRSNSKDRALAKITAVLKLLSFTTIAASCSSKSQCRPRNCILPRSLSKRLLQKSFWKKKRPEIRRPSCSLSRANSIRMISTSKILVRDIVRLGSFVDELRGGNTVVILKPTATASTTDNNSCSCSASEWWSEWDSQLSSPSDSASSEFNRACTLELEPSETVATVPPKRVGDKRPTAAKPDACRAATKEGIGGSLESTGLEYEEKEQLSPVSVMDFPDEEEEEDDDEGEASASSTAATTPSPFHQNLANIDRDNHLPHQKIRRLDCLAESVFPVDLVEYFDAAAEEEEEEEGEGEAVEDELQIEFTEEEARATELLEEVKRKFSANDDGLLLDFFVEELCKTKHAPRRKTWCENVSRLSDRTVDDVELLDRARDWLDGPRGGGSGTGRGRSGEAAIEEMDRDGRWRLFDEQEDEIAAALEDDAVDSLLDEIVLDMLAASGAH